MKITLRDCSHLTGAVVQTGTRIRITGVSTDSRKVKKGNIFFALRGEKFDGHQYWQDAYRQGASIVVVEKTWLEANGGSARGITIPVVAVPDTTKALGELAGIYRQKFAIPVLAIGGSNGKTTTKEMIASVLRKKYSVLSTEGNLNNHIGVPQMLFRLTPKHDIAVLELGTNHPGELGYLCSITRPTHALITNIGREHLEFFIDKRGVAQEETELFRAVEKKGTAFVNLNDQFLAPFQKKVRYVVSYGTAPRAAVRGMKMKLNDLAQPFFELRVKGKKIVYPLQLSAAGMHNVSNALAAAAVGTAFRVPVKKIAEALEQFNAAQKRHRDTE
jgi:UDP-N-acetylmuramoyl-tripeptide--D-alanyl-D-alanine ligase